VERIEDISAAESLLKNPDSSTTGLLFLGVVWTNSSVKYAEPIKRRFIMSYNWGPHYIVPSKVFESYSGTVMLREEFDEALLQKELEELRISGSIDRVANPWYYRKKNTDTWIKIGESGDIKRYFPVMWDTTKLEDGQYEVMGMMHIFVKKGLKEQGIASQNVVEVTVEN
jgi:hypothetical protein